jgi:WD40 repeat protein
LGDVKCHSSAKDVLGKLGRVNAADINAQSPDGCMQGTRVDLLRDLRAWSLNRDAPPIFWLNGMAGTGKSAIARSFCRILRDEGLLGGSFFCSRRGSADQQDVKRIIPTLAVALSSQDVAYMGALMNTLRQNTFSTDYNLEVQIRRLLEEPLSDNRDDSLPKMVLVIDALDECAEEGATADLLQRLAAITPRLPVKFFLTSRPERHIRAQLESPQADHRRVLRLHDIEGDVVEADIYHYITRRLQDIRASSSEPFPPDWPCQADVGAITRLSGKLFIYAFTAVEYVQENPLDYLSRLIQVNAPADKPLTAPLDEIYGWILSQSLDDRKRAEPDIVLTKRILSSILTVREPLPLKSFSELLAIPVLRIRNMLGRLHAVVYVPADDEKGVLTTFHASFGDFLTTRGRAPERIFVDLTIGHRNLCSASIEIMRSDMLHFNVSRCFTSYLPNSQQEIADIPAHLRYACLHWPYHLFAVPDPSSLLYDLERVFIPKFLFWLEVLSVVDKAGIASALILVATTSSGFVHASPRFATFLRDANRFIIGSLEAIEQSAPHIYISAFACLDDTSEVAREFSSRIDRLASFEVQGTRRQKEPLLHLRGHTKTVVSSAFSPDGTWIASGSHDRTVLVWDAQTGERVLRPLEGHGSGVSCVAFSPDGRLIVSGSYDNTIRVWDVHTAALAIKSFEGHTDWVNSVAFSPDGKHIVSGSRDMSIRVWDVETGMLAIKPFEGHVMDVASVAFSPDGTRIVSGSYDQTVRVWDAQKGMAVTEPLKGHNNLVSSVAFSSDGSRIVSGSCDYTIRVWHAQSGELVMKPLEGHSNSVSSVAFSPDGAYIVSGSWDHTIRVWDAQTGMLAVQVFEGDKDWVTSVAFSPDGKRIVSSSGDSTIRVWDVPPIGTLGSQYLEAHTGWVTSVAYSPDGKLIVSGSWDKTVRVWDAQTGVITAPPFEGHAGEVSSVAFLPDGKQIVSGSHDCTLRLWDAQTGTLAVPPFEGHTGQVLSVACSSDGARIVSGSADRTVRVWDAQTGLPSMQPLEGHRDDVTSVAFSPDGRYIVSGSKDCTVLVWDAQAGMLVMKPLEGYTDDITSVVFSPDGTRIASSSYDGTIRVWDALTGVLAMPPLEGHAHHALSVAFSSDGSRIVSGSAGQTVRVWDAHKGTLLMQPLEGHMDWVKSVAFSPDGSSIVSCSYDKIIRIWDMSDSFAEELQAGSLFVHITLSPYYLTS